MTAEANPHLKSHLDKIIDLEAPVANGDSDFQEIRGLGPNTDPKYWGSYCNVKGPDL